MCNFLSALLKRNGDIICFPEITDSHEELKTYANIVDFPTYDYEDYIKLEYTSDTYNPANLESYKLTVDQDIVPNWVNGDVLAKAEASLKRKLESLVIRDDSHRHLIGGCFLLLDNAKVSTIRHCRIPVIGGKAQVYNISDHTEIHTICEHADIDILGGDSLCHSGVTVSRIQDYAHITSIQENAAIFNVRDCVAINVMKDHSRINVIQDNAAIELLMNHAYIHRVEDKVVIRTMVNDSTIDQVKEMAQVKFMEGHSSVIYYRSMVKPNSICAEAKIYFDSKGE